MDVDTIFPAITLGEEMIAKFKYSVCCGSFELMVILTNLRLLIRTTVFTCGCFHSNSYSSINLRSIDRIDEARAGLNWYLILFLTSLFITAIVLFTVNNAAWIILGVIFLLISIGGFVLLFFLQRGRYIHLKGTFGSQFLQFSDTAARELDARLSEMIYRRKVQQRSEQGISQQRPVPAATTTTYQMNETQPLNTPAQEPYYNFQ